MKILAAVLAIALAFTSTASLGNPSKKKKADPAPQIEFEATIPVPIWERHGSVVVIKYDQGGIVGKYMQAFEAMSRAGMSVAIDGLCASACTLLLGYFPQNKICVTDNAQLGFHQSNKAEGTALMLMKYPEPILQWIFSGPALSQEIHVLPAEIMHRLWAACPAEVVNPPKLPPGEKID